MIRDFGIFLGLVKGNLSGTIGGGVVLGVSVVFIVIFALVFVSCFKHNNVNSNANCQRTLPNQHPQKHNRNNPQSGRTNREQAATHEIEAVPGKHRPGNHHQYQQQASVGYDVKKHSSTTQNTALGDSAYSIMGNQSPSKTFSTALNQSNGLMNYQNQQTVMNKGMERNNQRRS